MLLWHNLWFYFHILNSRKLATACTLTFIHSLIHSFNYFRNHSVVMFINAFIGLCCALGNDFLLLVAYSCSEVWNWLFFRVNKSDIRVKWAFRFYPLFLSLSLCINKTKFQSQLRLHWERQCHLSNFDADVAMSEQKILLVTRLNGKKAQMTFQSMCRTAYFLFNLKWTIAIGNINWKKSESQNRFVGFSVWICICGTWFQYYMLKYRAATSSPSFYAIENKPQRRYT